MRKIAALFLAILLCPVAGPGFAADDDISVIRLKNEGELKGVILEEGADGIVVDLGFGTVAVSKSEIREISRPEGQIREEASREWREHASSTNISEQERKIEAEKVRVRVEENRRLKEEAAERARRAGEHRVAFKDRSRIMVVAVLNGKVRTPLLVDTGASTVVIPLEVARQLMEDAPKDPGKVSAKLADGTVREGTPVLLESVEVSGARAENVQAIAMEMPRGHGLLGMSFLNRFHVRVDPEDNVLILKEK